MDPINHDLLTVAEYLNPVLYIFLLDRPLLARRYKEQQLLFERLVGPEQECALWLPANPAHQGAFVGEPLADQCLNLFDGLGVEDVHVDPGRVLSQCAGVGLLSRSLLRPQHDRCIVGVQVLPSTQEGALAVERDWVEAVPSYCQPALCDRVDVGAGHGRTTSNNWTPGAKLFRRASSPDEIPWVPEAAAFGTHSFFRMAHHAAAAAGLGCN
jgi:hypothetical protein